MTRTWRQNVKLGKGNEQINTAIQFEPRDAEQLAYSLSVPRTLGQLLAPILGGALMLANLLWLRLRPHPQQIMLRTRRTYESRTKD